jgi:hypothetical protein
LTRRHWTSLTDGISDISAHLSVARNHPGTDAGRASTKILLKHYKTACYAEMVAHHRHVSGQIPGVEFKAARVDGVLVET